MGSKHPDISAVLDGGRATAPAEENAEKTMSKPPSGGVKSVPDTLTPSALAALLRDESGASSDQSKADDKFKPSVEEATLPSGDKDADGEGQDKDDEDAELANCLEVFLKLLGHVESSTGATIIPRDLLQASKRKQAGDWLKVHQHLLKNKDYQITQEMEVKRRHVFRAVVADYPTFRPGSRLHPPPQVELIVAVRLYYVFKSRADDYPWMGKRLLATFVWYIISHVPRARWWSEEGNSLSAELLAKATQKAQELIAATNAEHLSDLILDVAHSQFVTDPALAASERLAAGEEGASAVLAKLPLQLSPDLVSELLRPGYDSNKARGRKYAADVALELCGGPRAVEPRTPITEDNVLFSLALLEREKVLGDDVAAHCTVKVQKQAPTLEEIIGKEVGSAGLEMFNGIFSAAAKNEGWAINVLASFKDRPGSLTKAIQELAGSSGSDEAAKYEAALNGVGIADVVAHLDQTRTGTGMGMLAAWGGLNGEAGGERGAVSEDSSDDWLTELEARFARKRGVGTAGTGHCNPGKTEPVGDGDDETDVPTLSAEEAEKQCLALLDDMLADRLKKAAGRGDSV